MSIEYFLALEGQIPAVEAERSLHLADAMTYPQMKREDARQWWAKNVSAITRTAERTAQAAGAMFMVDGQAVGVAGLRRWLRGVVGSKGLTA